MYSLAKINKGIFTLDITLNMNTVYGNYMGYHIMYVAVFSQHTKLHKQTSANAYRNQIKTFFIFT